MNEINPMVAAWLYILTTLIVFWHSNNAWAIFWPAIVIRALIEKIRRG